MPLPSGGTWPPPALALVTDKHAEWSAWYSGEADQLAYYYGGDNGGYDTTSRARVNRPAQYRGGVSGALARWWWGRPTSAGAQRTKLHIPIASDIAATSADLLFSEPPSLSVEHTKTQDRLDELVDDGLHATLLEGAEICAGLGGVYPRIVWDREARPEGPWLDVVHADAAVPEWRWGKLSAVTFWRIVHREDQLVVRHLERHEVGAIVHGLYQGTETDLGQRIPLTEHEATAPLAEVVTEGDTIRTGIDRLTAVYWPNVRPNRRWRDLPQAIHLGRSDYAGVEGLMDAIDETYSSWMRDIRLAKARITVPRAYLQSAGPGQGASFDLDQELYEAVDALPGPGLDLSANQFAIRVAEHQATVQDLLGQILRTSGYSTQTFGLTGEAAVTATEVTARERRSFVTRDKKIVYARAPLSEIFETLLMVDKVHFGSGVEPSKPDMEFGDSVSEDPRALAETANLLAQAQAASIETKVRLVHPEWDDKDVDAEVEKIKDENGLGEPVADPLALPLTGGQGFPPDPNAPPVQDDPTNAPPADGPPAGGD